MNAAAAKPPRGLTGVHVLILLLLFFGSVIAMNAYFVVQSVESFPGEDEARSYAQGLKYNATLADRAQQAALGWRAEASLSADGAEARVALKLTDRNGAPLTGLSMTGALRRPVDAKEDHALTFSAAGDGLYVATLPNLAAGQWTLHARARGPGGHLDIAKALLWPTPQR